jgi:hypothetical protein
MSTLAGPAVNRRLKCMEEIDDNLAEMEDFSGRKEDFWVQRILVKMETK